MTPLENTNQEEKVKFSFQLPLKVAEKLEVLKRMHSTDRLGDVFRCALNYYFEYCFRPSYFRDWSVPRLKFVYPFLKESDIIEIKQHYKKK